MPPPPPPPPPRSTGEGLSAEASAEVPQVPRVPRVPQVGRQSSAQMERLQGELLFMQEENRRLHALLADREGEGMQASSSSKKKNLSLFQQMLSRRDERDERLDAEGHAEVGGAARADT